jgi:hypothetical protein
VRPLAAVVVALALLAGCGEGETESANPATLLASAIARADQGTSFESSFEMQSDLGGQVVEVSGTFRSSADATRARGPMKYAEDGEDPFEFELILLDDEAFLRSDQLADVLPRGKQWMRVQDDTLAQQSLTPKQFVEFLRETPDVEELGREPIRGKQTVHLRGKVDLAKAAERVGGGPIVEMLERSPELADKVDAVADAWIGEQDERLERIALTMRVDGEQGSMTFSGDMLEDDVSLDDVVAPPERLVIDEKDVSDTG